MRCALLPVVLIASMGCGMRSSGEAPARDVTAPAEPPAANPLGPVILELFTSQGCSSCPPADRLLSSLARGATLAGRPVIPLAFHVDYWDDLGWRDPHGSPRWSQRQGWYARRLGGRGVYTPELVVAGRSDAIGSRRAEIERLIAATPATAELAASLRRDAATWWFAADAPADAEVWAAVVEDGLTVDVAAGENAGEQLRNDHVVRALVRVAAAGERGEVAVTIEPGWRDVHGIAFAQDRDSGAIVAAQVLD